MKEMVYQSERTIDVLEDNYYKDHYYVVLSLGTHPCGYVEVPKSNKLYGIYMDKIWDKYDIKCNGGVTYTRRYLSLDNKNETYRGWWIGWDYTHCWDYDGSLLKYSFDISDKKKWTTPEIVAECKSVIDQLIEYKKE